MPSLPDPCLTLITDRTLLPPGMPLAQAVACAVTGGIDLVVMQEEELPAAPRLTLARFVRSGIRGRAPLLTTGDPAFAIQAGAEGAHLKDAINIAEARALLGPQRLLGVTARSLEEVRRAEVGEADYLLVSLDWAEPEKALRTLRTFSESTTLPSIAALDIPVEWIPFCRQAGAVGVAICAPAMCAYDRTAAVREYAEVLGVRR